jgi:O-antigen/teichoic acid export membrane protein
LQNPDQIATREAPTPACGNPISLKTLGRAVGRTSWAVIDQGLLSLSNFVVNLVLALWLTPAEYGGYTAATAAFWISLGIQGGLIIQPMTVFGSGRFHDRPSAYLAVLMIFDWWISVMISAALAIVGLGVMFLGSRLFGMSMLGYAVAAPLVLLLSLLKRTFYVWSHPRLAAGASAIYMVGMFTILYALYRSGILSPFTAPLTTAGASALAIAGAIAMGRFRLRSSWRGEFLREVAAAHWRYGRWAVLTEVIAWAPGRLYYLIVPVFVGLEANAALNVLWNLIMPAVQLITAANLLLVPAFSRLRHDRRGTPLMWIVVLILVAGALLYALLVGLFGGTLIDLVYRGRYTQYAHLTWIVGLIVLPIAARITFGSALRARERPDRELSAYLTATVVACVGIVAIAAWGLLGAILGQLVAETTTMLVMLWWVLRTDSRAEAQTPAGPAV